MVAGKIYKVTPEDAFFNEHKLKFKTTVDYLKDLYYHTRYSDSAMLYITHVYPKWGNVGDCIHRFYTCENCKNFSDSCIICEVPETVKCVCNSTEKNFTIDPIAPVCVDKMGVHYYYDDDQPSRQNEVY
jgi:hypothetical protein